MARIPRGFSQQFEGFDPKKPPMIPLSIGSNEGWSRGLQQASEAGFKVYNHKRQAQDNLLYSDLTQKTTSNSQSAILETDTAQQKESTRVPPLEYRAAVLERFKAKQEKIFSEENKNFAAMRQSARDKLLIYSNTVLGDLERSTQLDQMKKLNEQLQGMRMLDLEHAIQSVKNKDSDLGLVEKNVMRVLDEQEKQIRDRSAPSETMPQFIVRKEAALNRYYGFKNKAIQSRFFRKAMDIDESFDSSVGEWGDSAEYVEALNAGKIPLPSEQIAEEEAINFTTTLKKIKAQTSATQTLVNSSIIADMMIKMWDMSEDKNVDGVTLQEFVDASIQTVSKMINKTPTHVRAIHMLGKDLGKKKGAATIAQDHYFETEIMYDLRMDMALAAQAQRPLSRTEFARHLYKATSAYASREIHFSQYVKVMKANKEFSDVRIRLATTQKALATKMIMDKVYHRGGGTTRWHDFENAGEG